jgi:hypothetical protein
MRKSKYFSTPSQTSEFDREAGIRRDLAVKIKDHLEFYIGEFNSRETRQRVVASVGEVLSEHGGVRYFKVTCDEKLNPPHLIDDNKLLVEVYVIFNRLCHRIMFCAENFRVNWDKL